MDYTQEQLDLIRDYGEQLTPPEECAALLGVDELEFIEDVTTKGSIVRDCYVAGMARTANNLRRQSIEAAMAGSPAAISVCLQQLSRINI